MSCTRPMPAWQAPEGGELSFSELHSERSGMERMNVSCGSCMMCTLRKAMDYGVVGWAEGQLYPVSTFVTLTYAPEHLPKDRSVSIRDWSTFRMRLRSHIGPFRFLHAGEYGDLKGRAHDHAIIYGYDLRRPDDTIISTAGDLPLHGSRFLADIWQKGAVQLRQSNGEAAFYTAGYCVKKTRPKPGQARPAPRSGYLTNKATGEQVIVKSPYVSASKLLGKAWLQAHYKDVYEHDRIHVGRRHYPVPKRFDNYLKAIDPSLFEEVKLRRENAAQDYFENVFEGSLAEQRRHRLARETSQEKAHRERDNISAHQGEAWRYTDA